MELQNIYSERRGVSTIFSSSLLILTGIPDYVNLYVLAGCSSCLSLTPGRRQSKTLLIIGERGSKLVRNSVFDCHLSPVGRQMAIENSVLNEFLSTFVDCIDVFDCHLPGVSL